MIINTIESIYIERHKNLDEEIYEPINQIDIQGIWALVFFSNNSYNNNKVLHSIRKNGAKIQKKMV